VASYSGKTKDGFPSDPTRLMGRARDARAQERRKWDLSSLFLAGYQWLNFDVSSSAWTGVDDQLRQASGGNRRITVNLLLDLYRTALSTLQATYPTIRVRPTSPSIEDLAKATGAEVSLRYHWEVAGMREVISRHIQQVVSFGTAALVAGYDEEEDEIYSRSLNAYDIFPEPGLDRMEHCEWIALRSVVSRESLEEAYNTKKASKKKSKIVQAISNAPNAYTFDSTYLGQSSADRPKNRVEVFEWFFRDDKWAVSIGNDFIFKGEWPAPTRHFPVQITKYTDVEERLWGLSYLEPLLELQYLHNEFESLIINALAMMGKPKVLIPYSSGVRSDSFNNQLGEKIGYHIAGGAPGYLTPPQLPDWVREAPHRLQSKMHDVAGFHGVSTGRRQPGIESGRAINALAARDTQQLQITMSAIENSLAHHMCQVLKLQKVFYNEDRFHAMLDSEGAWTHLMVTSSNISDSPDVVIKGRSLFMKEQDAMAEEIYAKVQMGILTPEEAQREIATGQNVYWINRVKDYSHAQFVIDAVKQGAQAEIFPTDNLQVFQEVLEQTMRNFEFYQLPPDRQDALLEVYYEVIGFGMAEEQYAALKANRRVSPRVSSMRTMNPAMPPVDAGGPGGVGMQSQTLSSEQLDRGSPGVGREAASRGQMKAEAMQTGRGRSMS